jgi:hypothetical protein
MTFHHPTEIPSAIGPLSSAVTSSLGTSVGTIVASSLVPKIAANAGGSTVISGHMGPKKPGRPQKEDENLEKDENIPQKPFVEVTNGVISAPMVNFYQGLINAPSSFIGSGDNEGGNSIVHIAPVPNAQWICEVRGLGIFGRMNQVEAEVVRILGMIQDTVDIYQRIAKGL